MSKVTAAKKTGKKVQEEKVNDEIDINFDIETVTFETLKSQIKNDDDYDKIFNKLNEHYANFGTEKNKLNAEAVTLAGKHKKTIDLMKSLHKEFKDDQGSDEHDSEADDEQNDDDDVAESAQEAADDNEVAEVVEEVKPVKPAAKKAPVKKAPVKKAAPAKAPVKKVATKKK